MKQKIVPRDKGILHDSRVDCHSIMLLMTADQYLSMVAKAYVNRGGIEGQREKLRTTSAIRIRRRMVDDIANGAVLPPVVVGAVVRPSEFRQIADQTIAATLKFLKALDSDRFSIIDGMQRTTALQEAISVNKSVGKQSIRVELWISKSTNSLIYRMLVLNTGQVPWNLRSQVEIVFKSLIVEIKDSVANLEVLQTVDERRRSKGGQFQANELVELFLVFGARKEKIDIRERLADEFTRLDFMDAASDDSFTGHFCSALGVLVNLDISFDQYRPAKNTTKSRFHNGRDLFASQPACVGLITAVATYVFGRPGTSRAPTEQVKRMARIERGVILLIQKLAKLSTSELDDFLAFRTLNEAIARGRSGLSVGDMEREFFLRAFQVLLDEDCAVEDLTPCWRAY